MSLILGFKLAIGLLWVMTPSSAYSIDKSCQGTDLDNVKAAAAEAIQVLQYAQDRIRWQFANIPPAPYDGTLLQDLMGNNDAITWQNAKTWFNVAINQIGPYNTAEDGRVLIYCNDLHLTSGGVNEGKFFDNSRPQTKFWLKPGMNGGCMNNYYAFGYPIWTDPMTGSGQQYYAIVLCKGYPGSTLEANAMGLKVLQNPNAGLEDLSVDALAKSMTTKLLHEFIHMASPVNQFPTKFADGTSEVYSYAAISAKNPDGNYIMPQINKLHNAESYSLVAASLYANGFYVSSGKLRE